VKSLRYILGRRPHTLDDCLDLARSQPVDNVTLDVTVDELVSDSRILHQFVGTYRWQFADRDICCKEVYGCVSLPATEQQQEYSRTRANAKLRRRIEEIQQQGIELIGTNQRFQESENLCGGR
jgi:hypothetical protein